MPIPDIDFRLTGLEQANANINELSRQFGPRRARQTFNVPLRRAFANVEADIRANTPVDTGNLRDTTQLRAGVANRFERRRFPDAVYAVRAGWFYSAPSPLTFQALAVEYGTRYQTGNRTLRTALANNAEGAIDIFCREIGNSIMRTARRLNRRRAAGRI